MLAVDTVTVAAATLTRSALLRPLVVSIPATFWLSSTKLANTLFGALDAIGVSGVCTVAMLLFVALFVFPVK